MVNVTKLRSREFKKPKGEDARRKTNNLRRIIAEEIERFEDASRAGTNYILGEVFGLSNEVRNNYGAAYGPKVLKDGSRIALQHYKATGQMIDFRYLFEAIYQLGRQAVSDLLRMKKDLAVLLSDYDILKSNGAFFVVPRATDTSLEKLTSSQDPNAMLRAENLAPVYKRGGVLLYESTKK